MSRQRLGELQWWSILEVMVLAILILGCAGKELVNGGPGPVNNTAVSPGKACFIFDRNKLPAPLKNLPDVNVTCLPDGVKSFPPVPELEFKGVKFSSISFKKDPENPPETFAFNEFKISDKDGASQAEYFKKCRRLYESVWLGLRSVDAKKHVRPIRELETVMSFINLQIRRLEEGVESVEAALNDALKKCFQCGVKARYNLIALASQSGVDPDRFLKNLHELKCKTRKECLDLLKNSDNANGWPTE